jgi:ribosomal-protein-alanine N-acetyltransferase
MMIDYSPLAYRVEPMRSEDLGAVMEIERVAFSAPWSARAYDYELHYNEMAHYYVARRQQIEMLPYAPTPRQSWWQRVLALAENSPAAEHNGRAPVVGYGGFWLMADETHISTIATHPQLRRRGIGGLLLLAMLDDAAEIGASIATLEVRASNTAAQALYRKYGFEVVGSRRNYYSDNGEDALIMSTPTITTATFARQLQALRAALFACLSR